MADSRTKNKLFVYISIFFPQDRFLSIVYSNNISYAGNMTGDQEQVWETLTLPV